MVAVMLMSVLAVAGLCVLAYTLAVYGLPFMLGVTAAQFAYHTGAGFIGAGLVGFVAAFGVLALLFDTLRSPILRLIVALVFAAPAAVAGYALVHGVTKGSRAVRNLARVRPDAARGRHGPAGEVKAWQTESGRHRHFLTL